jgi:hypothetical protein
LLRSCESCALVRVVRLPGAEWGKQTRGVRIVGVGDGVLREENSVGNLEKALAEVCSG